MTAAPTPTRSEAVGRGTGARAEDLLARQARRERAARIHARSLPIVPVRTRGMTVDGADGRRYLDCLAGAGPLVLGHSHPVVLEAIRTVPEAETPSNARATPTEARFVETLFATLPAEFARDARILFCGPEGTDAVDAAIGLARGATGREGVLVSAGLCRGALPEAGAVTRLPYPDPARAGETGGGIAELLADAAARGAVPSAVVLEAVRGDGEMVPAPDAWLREIRRVTQRYGVALVVDETQTGLARTGAFWALEHSGIVPDTIVVPQAAGGSLPLTAVVARGEPHPGGTGAHAAAFRGNQLAMAAGAATIRHIRENHLAAHAARIGTRLAHGLRRIQADEPVVGDVRGRGLMLGIELVDPDGAPPPAAGALAAAVRTEALDRGLIIGLGGRDDTILRLLPPLTMTEEQAEAVLTRLADAVAAAARRRRKSGPPQGC